MTGNWRGELAHAETVMEGRACRLPALGVPSSSEHALPEFGLSIGDQRLTDLYRQSKSLTVPV